MNSRLKKTAAGLLSAAMLLTMTNMPIFADDALDVQVQEDTAVVVAEEEAAPEAEQLSAEEQTATEEQPVDEVIAEDAEQESEAAAEDIAEQPEAVEPAVSVEAVANTAEEQNVATPAETKPVPETSEKALAEPQEDKSIDLTVTNNTGMFKATSARLVTEGGQEYLIMALSSDGYRELCKGTYEQAVAGGDGSEDKGNNSWIHGKTNKDGKLEFKIPLSAGESYVPCVAVSNSYYTKFLSGQNSLERAFYPRQFTINRAAKTLVTDDYNETADFTVTSEVADFKVNAKASTKVVGGPNSNNYCVAPTLVMEDNTYELALYPTIELVLDPENPDKWGEAELNNNKFEIELLNAPSVPVFTDKEPITMKFLVAYDAPYKEANSYVERQVTIDKMAKTITITGNPLTPIKDDSGQQTDPADPTNPDKPVTPDKPSDQTKPVRPPKPARPDKPSGNTTPEKEGYKDDASTYAPSVNASTTLKDGVYAPDSFSFSGGTGKVNLSCTKITVRGGQAYATIVFSSSKFDQLRAAGSTYYKQGGGNSTFEIPVKLNANNTIVGRTTAMSQPHWIEYTIWVGKAESAEEAAKVKEAKKEAAEAKLKISDKAPAIVGLKAKDGEEAKSDTAHAKYFKIFEYEQGVKLLSIDISQDTALHEEYTKNAEKAIEDSDKEETVEYDDEGNIITRTDHDYTEALYKNNVVNYLLVPEDFEVPAGLEKEYIIVTVPAEKTFMASPEAIDMMKDLDCLNAVSLLGMDEKDVKEESLKQAIKDDKVKTAGDLEKPDYQKVVKDKTELAILPDDLLPEEIKEDAKDKDKLTEEAKDMQKDLEKLESRFTTLDIPVIIDRSAQEKDELAQAEWIKVYGALYGCEEQADKIFDELVKKADKK